MKLRPRLGKRLRDVLVLNCCKNTAAADARRVRLHPPPAYFPRVRTSIQSATVFSASGEKLSSIFSYSLIAPLPAV